MNSRARWMSKQSTHADRWAIWRNLNTTNAASPEPSKPGEEGRTRKGMTLNLSLRNRNHLWKCYVVSLLAHPFLQANHTSDISRYVSPLSSRIPLPIEESGFDIVSANIGCVFLQEALPCRNRLRVHDRRSCARFVPRRRKCALVSLHQLLVTVFIHFPQAEVMQGRITHDECMIDDIHTIIPGNRKKPWHSRAYRAITVQGLPCTSKPDLYHRIFSILDTTYLVSSVYHGWI